MKDIASILTICSSLMVSGVSTADSTADSNATCEKDEFEVVELLLHPEAACGDEVSNRDLQEAIRVVDQYWSWETTRAQRYGLLEKGYGELILELYGVNKPEHYGIPNSEEEKFWSGYSIMAIRAFEVDSFEVSAKVRWEQEGYSGVTTFVFVLCKTTDGWRISHILN